MTTEPQLDLLEMRLVWMVGSPRSGSTWLLRLLVYPWGVGQTATGIDASRWLPPGPNAMPINESYLPMHLGPLRELTTPISEVENARLLLNDQRASDPSYFFSDEYEDVWKAGARRLTLERFQAQVDRASSEHGLDGPLVVIKEPNGSHAADLIARIHPASRMIFLLRDGRDVVDSMLEADSPGGWRTRNEGVQALETPEDRLAAVRRHAYHWALRTVAVERACRMLGPDRWMRVRYEDLLADTEGELTRLLDWLGIERTERQVARAVRANRFGSLRNRLRGSRKGVRAASPGLWRENMSDEEQALLGDLLDPKLKQLGYAV
jgi:hypothetical protein